jgi:hypothetical protein
MNNEEKYLKHLESLRKAQKKYRESNKEKISEYNKKYYSLNKEEILFKKELKNNLLK